MYPELLGYNGETMSYFHFQILRQTLFPPLNTLILIDQQRDKQDPLISHNDGGTFVALFTLLKSSFSEVELIYYQCGLIFIGKIENGKCL